MDCKTIIESAKLKFDSVKRQKVPGKIGGKKLLGGKMEMLLGTRYLKANKTIRIILYK